MKNDKPNEIPVPQKKPEIVPPAEPEPVIWPTKEPEIQPGEEPITTPPAPSQIPVPSENRYKR